MTPLDKLVKYIRKRYETNESFENLITSLREEESGILEFEKEESYKRGHEDGWQEGGLHQRKTSRQRQELGRRFPARPGQGRLRGINTKETCRCSERK